MIVRDGMTMGDDLTIGQQEMTAIDGGETIETKTDVTIPTIAREIVLVDGVNETPKEITETIVPNATLRETVIMGACEKTKKAVMIENEVSLLLKIN
jgi:hypothetical protein